ncbi:MAG: DUF3570 domain-containing protein [Myxococcales bacterium]
MIALGVALRPTVGLADESSGTFTGSVSARGNYYWERSTRVLAPATTVTLESPHGGHMDATYLIDAITSASQATGVVADHPFTEIRNDIGGGLGYEFDLGKAQLDLTARGRFSKEPDYLSRGLGFASSLSLNHRLTVISLTGNYNFDDVGRVVRMVANPTSDKLIAKQRQHVGDLDVLSFGLSVDQVLSRTAWIQLGYDGAFLDGFQANAYRLIAYKDGGGAASEKHPDQRVRHAGYVWYEQYVTQTRSAVRLGYRLYHDSWNITAHVPEIRLYQEIGPFFDVRLRYRYYKQNGADFWHRVGYVHADKYITNDPKMSPFHDQTVGLKLRVNFEFLAFTPLDFFHTAALDFGVEYVFNTNRYGNGLIGQGGLSWAF